MNWITITLIVIAVIAVIVGLLVLLYKKKVVPKYNEYESLLNENKIVLSIFIIDKYKDKLANQNFPKSVVEQIPKVARLRKFPLVKAKVGTQIMTLIVDERIFKRVPVKKMVKAELAGMYLMNIK